MCAGPACSAALRRFFNLKVNFFSLAVVVAIRAKTPSKIL
jgi:hypothetical protein